MALAVASSRVGPPGLLLAVLLAFLVPLGLVGSSTAAAASPTFVAKTSASGASRTLAVAAPAGTTAGDVQVAVAVVGTSSETVSTPAGWTLAKSLSNAGGTSKDSFRAHVFTSTTATGSTTFTKSGSRAWQIVRAAYRGAAGVGASAIAARTGTTPSTPSVTTSGAADLVVGGVVTDGTPADTFTPPNGWKERHDTCLTGEVICVTTADVPVPARATRTGTFTTSNRDESIAYAVVVKAGSGSTPAPAPTTPPQPTTPTPAGIAGSWNLVFGDDFNGTSLDTTKWTSSWFDGGIMNRVSTPASNVSVANGEVRLQLSSSSAGALIHTTQKSGRYSVRVGDALEARIWFPGNGTDLYNWPAFWANDTDTYPAGGEHDIAEVLSAHRLTVNYHSPSGAHNQGAVAGYWGDAWHTYALHRKKSSADVYWDGKLVKSYPTDDNGSPEDVILNIGRLSSSTNGVNPVTGPAGALRVDYVRAWRPQA